jgi:phosphatidylinositol 4-kinase
MHSSFSFFKKYLTVNQQSHDNDAFELGASIAENFGKAVGPEQRQLSKFIAL